MPSADPLTGKNLGDVTLVRVIAEGGMGRVYEGLQDKPRRAVAVKVMRPGFVSQEVCRRFNNEAEVLGRLRHPYIAQIYSAGICTIVGAQVPFFVMEYVADALPLTAYAKQHSLYTQHRLELFRKVCEAVAHGHEKGVIHRDLKPSNILVEPGGLPKVIDFGIARCVDATPEQMTALTDIGKLIGTVQYMSPEQFSGDSTRIDQRSDVYALGVILYELLAGRPPYKISHKQIFEAAQVVRKYRPTPLSKFNRDIDPTVEKVANRCLQKHRDLRFADAAEVANALGPCVDGRPIPKVARTSWSQRLRILQAALWGEVWFDIALVISCLALGSLLTRPLNTVVLSVLPQIKKSFDDFGSEMPKASLVLGYALYSYFPIAHTIISSSFVLLRRARSTRKSVSTALADLLLISAALFLLQLLLLGICVLPALSELWLDRI